jgi:hypothetical protein
MKFKLFLMVFLYCWKYNYFWWYFQPPKLLVAISADRRYGAGKNSINLFPTTRSPAAKNNIFQGLPLSPFPISNQFSIHKIHTHIYSTVINTFSQLYDPSHQPQTQLFKSHFHKHVKIIHKHTKSHIHTHQQVSHSYTSTSLKRHHTYKVIHRYD